MIRRSVIPAVFALALALLSRPALAIAQEPAAQKPRAEARAATPLNLNSATAADLETLPGIGAATAARIVEYRQKHGSFKKIEDLMNVKGIGEKSFLKLKPLLTIGPARAERPTA